jgi:hypothetical protein
MEEDEMNYSDSHLDKGEMYDERFNHKPAFDQSRFERKIIAEILRMCKPKRFLTLLVEREEY